MRLDFKILWVEDHPAEVVEDKKAIADALRHYGFEAVVTPLTGYSEVHELMKNTSELEDFDLILVDLDLGNTGGDGGDAAFDIRGKFPHREMVFYTGKSNDDLRAAAIKKDIQGVYFAQRPYLAEEVDAVIENMLRKTVDVTHMRGIVMAETSELDHYLECCLDAAYETLKPDRKKGFHNRAVGLIHERFTNNLKKLESLSSPEKFRELLRNNHLMTSYDKTRALKRYLETETNDDSSKDHHRSVHGYEEDIQPVRNTLAHGVVVREDGRQIFKGQNEEEVDQDAMRQWRVNLLDHRKRIRNVADHFDVSFGDE